ncbi:MAG: ABC transporter permease [Phycisphaerae bacterium]|nr:ABC transporter permease [Phycisphaerae bacterium]
MAMLPLANLMHHKLASTLNALGIGIGICMLLTLSGLARGTLFEVSDRAQAADADLIVCPSGWGDGVVTRSGVGLWESYAKLIKKEHGDIVERIVPVFVWPIKLAGQDHRATGVSPEMWHTLTGGRKLSAGRLFDPENKFATWLEKELLTEAPEDGPAEDLDLTKAPHDGLELVIDERLAEAGGFRVGQKVVSANRTWTIVGTVPAGVITRVFMPRRTAQYLFGDSIQRCTLMFVKLKDGCDVGPAASAIKETTGQDVMPLTAYRGMLKAKFDLMFGYIDTVNGVALSIAFLFIMITLYTMVLQRNRDIAILKSSGASWLYITRQVMVEAALLTLAGTVLGVALAFAAGWLIQTLKPLYTVEITPKWVLIAFCAAAVGATLSSIYPAWRAARVDMAEVLAQD